MKGVRKKIKIIYSDRFSERNFKTSGLICSLNELFFIDLEQNVFKKSFVFNSIENVKRILQNCVIYRFATINRFKKYLAKRQHQKDSDLDKRQDKLYAILGFPFPKSKHVFNLLYWIYTKFPSGIKENCINADLVLITSGQERVAQSVIRYSEKLNIPVIVLINSWDHLTHRGKVIQSKIIRNYLVWNEIQKNELIDIHDIVEDKIKIVGALPFDLFNNDKVDLLNLNTKKRYKISENEKILFLPAYNMRHGKHEPRVIRYLLEHLNKISYKFKLIIRPYPTDNTFDARFSDILLHPNVILSPLRDDVEEDRRNMSELLMHSDVVLSGCGTVAVEAMFYDTPVIHLAIDVDESKGQNSLFKKFYFSDHYQHIMKHNPSHYVETYEEFISAINVNLEHPELKQAERKKVIKEQIGFLDGKAHQRIADIVFGLLKE